MKIFYSNGEFKKKKFYTRKVYYADSYHIVYFWMGNFEPEPRKQNTFKHKLPDKFKPKPAYKGAK